MTISVTQTLGSISSATTTLSSAQQQQQLENNDDNDSVTSSLVTDLNQDCDNIIISTTSADCSGLSSNNYNVVQDDTQHDDSIPPPLNIEYVPTDAMNLILSYCTFADYRNLSVATKRLYQAVSRASHLLMEANMGSPAEYDKSPSQRSLNNSSHADVEIPVRLDAARLRQILNRFKSLDTLQLDGLAAVGDDLLSIINDSDCVNTLTSLSLNGLSLTYWCTGSLNIPNLKHLKLGGGSIRTSLDKFFASSNNNSNAQQHNNNNNSIQTLGISQCSSLRDEQISRDIVKHLNTPNFTALSIHQCLRIRQPTLQFTQAPLTSLSLMGCFALCDLPDFDCPTLEHLDLSFCFRLSTNVIQRTIAKLPNLKELILIKCTALDKLTIVHMDPHISLLRTSAAINNTDSISTAVQCSQSLKWLNVNFCSGLKKLELACPNLVRLDNVACANLDTLIMNNADSIKEINVSALPVTRLELYTHSLKKLNISGCKKLDHCVIHSPNLEKVVYRGSRQVALRFCKEVREVIMKNWTVAPLERMVSGT